MTSDANPALPLRAGSSSYLNLGARTKPGAIGLTTLETRTEAEKGEALEYHRRIAADMAQMPGFLGWLGAVVGHRIFTVTAWEHPENTLEFLGTGAHRDAMNRFFGPGFAAGGQTGVWVPHHLNAMSVRCEACGRMVAATARGGACGRCGRPLPEHPPYW